MSAGTPAPQDVIDDVLSPADIELFSLFMQYPDMTFDSEDTPRRTTRAKLYRHNDIDSSPLSTLSDVDTMNTFPIGTSTATTTPLCPLLLAELDTSRTRGWTRFLRLVEQNSLPRECQQYFSVLGYCIVNIGLALLDVPRYKKPVDIPTVGAWFLKHVRYSSDQVNGQISRINHLTTLLAFTCQPTVSQMWWTYQQRAWLILTNVSPPSKSESGLLEYLIFLYDAYVYNPFLQVHHNDNIADDTVKVLHDIYNHLMAWLSRYQRWCQAAQRLRSDYMKPLVEGMHKCPEAQEELNDFQARLTQARAVLTKPVQVDNMLAEEKLVKALNLSARRLGAEKGIALRRTKTRYRREHTL